MKSRIALGLLLLLLPLCLTGCAGSGAPAAETPAYRSALERYTSLMTEHEWVLTPIDARHNMHYIRLTDPELILTGDGSGNVHLYFTSDSTGRLSTFYFGVVSFSADEQTMIVTTDDGKAYTYKRN